MTARQVARIAGFAGVTAGMLPAFVAHEALARQGEKERVREKWVAAWAGALLALFGVRETVRGAAAGTGKGRLVVASHRSTADILLLLKVVGGRMVSRADLARWPLVGVAARSVGTLFVDRKDAGSGATAVRTIKTRLQAGDTVIVFPEGTTFPDDEVRPFHAGAFVAAAKAGADVLPVGIAYQTGSGAAFVNESFPAHLARMAAAPPSRVALCIGEAIAGAGVAKASELRDLAHERVQQLVREARALVDASSRRRSSPVRG